MIYKWIFLIFLWSLSFSLQADIGVSPIIVDLSGKEADAEIAVKNFDTKNNAYVEITPYRLFDPINYVIPKKRVQHPEKEGLLVFPAKLMLLPGQTQFVRVIKTAKSLTSDQIYEVDFIPKIATHLINHHDPSGIMLGIRVIVGYGVRVTLRPDSRSPMISVKRVQDNLIIQNKGNTALTITSCTQQVSGEKIQIPLPAYTLFVGQTIKKQLTQLSPVTLDVALMGKSLGPFKTD